MGLKKMSWVLPLAGVVALVSLALRAALQPSLAVAGFDPVFGFLLSANPALRAAAIVQVLGSAVASVGGLVAVFWRKR